MIMEPEIHEIPPKDKSTHPIEALALIALFAAAVLFSISLIHIYEIPYGIDFGEGYLANASWQMVQGNNPYHSLDNPPWIVTSYPPLFPAINGLLMSLFGVSLVPGRFIATLSFISMLILVGSILRKFGVGLSVAILSAGFLLVYPWPVNWAQVVRVDTLGIALAAAGIYCWIRSDKKSDAVLAAIFFSLAAFTKQSLLAGAMAAIIYGLLSRDKRTLLLLVLCALLTGGAYLITNLITGGWFLQHLFTYTANTFFTERLTIGLGQYFKSTWLVQVLAVMAFVIPGCLSGPKILGWYFLLSHLTLAAYGLEGSDTNYFIEPLMSSALLAGLTLGQLAAASQEQTQSGHPYPSSRTIAYSLVLAVIILGRFINTTDYRIERANQERINNGKELIRLEAGALGDVLSEDASFTLLAGKPVLYQPYIMSLLSRKGKWDQAPFIKTINDEKYSIIVLRVDLSNPNNTENRGEAWEAAGFDRWTTEAEDAIKEHYVLYGGTDAGVGNLWYVYLAKSQMP